MKNKKGQEEGGFGHAVGIAIAVLIVGIVAYIVIGSIRLQIETIIGGSATFGCNNIAPENVVLRGGEEINAVISSSAVSKNHIT